METETNSREGLQIDKKVIGGIMLLLLVVLCFAGILTQILPRGQFALDENGAVIAGTYTEDPTFKLPIWKIVASPVLSFGSSNALTGLMIVLILMLVGGSFLILDRIGVLQYLMARIVKRFQSRRYLLIAMMTLAGMFLSSTAGILEESIPLVPLAVAISLAMGWDSLLGVGMSFVAVAFGFTAATFNPFNVITVQKLADLPIFSGLWLRLLVFAAVYVSLTGFLILYARKIEKNPEKSPVRQSDAALRERYPIDECFATLQDSNIARGAGIFVASLCLVLIGTVASFIMSLIGSKTDNALLTTVGSYGSMGFMGVFFPAGALLAGAASGLHGKKLFLAFGKGIKSILPVIPLILFVLSITYVLDEGRIMHTILNGLSGVMQHLSPYLVILLMFAFIALLEFFIGSGTAKAFLIVPLMSILCDLLGVTRQSMVLTFCFADGFTNLLYPTSGLMILVIGMIGVSYKTWLKWSGKLFLMQGVISLAFMMLAVAIGYQ